MYEKNLKVLAKYYPQMDELIENAKKDINNEIEVLEEESYNGEPVLKIKKEEISTKIAQSISRQGFQPRAFREILLAALQILREYIRKLRIPSKPKLGC